MMGLPLPWIRACSAAWCQLSVHLCIDSLSNTRYLAFRVPAEEEPPAKEQKKPAEIVVPGKLKDTIFTAAAEEKRDNGGAVLATPTSATGPKRHIGISLQTPRGAEFDLNEVDPSGTKGTGDPLKYTPGKVRVHARFRG
jgi:hypothetical protein